MNDQERKNLIDEGAKVRKTNVVFKLARVLSLLRSNHNQNIQNFDPPDDLESRIDFLKQEIKLTLDQI